MSNDWPDLISVPLGGTPVELVVSEVPAVASRITALRRALEAWLGATAFDARRTGDIVLAVYEAMANVVEHAYRQAAATGTITLRAAYSAADRVLQVAVIYHGQWSTTEPDPVRGNGIPLMTALCTTSSIDHTATGTSVLLQWHD